LATVLAINKAIESILTSLVKYALDLLVLSSINPIIQNSSTFDLVLS